MTFDIIPTKCFLEQIAVLGEKEKRIITEKIELLKISPYRFKKIHSQKYSKVFRIRLMINNADSRLIYHIIEPQVILVCFLARKDDYRDLEKYLSKM